MENNEKFFTEQEMIDLLMAADEAPTVSVKIKRFGFNITLKGLTYKEFAAARKECTEYTTSRGKEQEAFDSESYSANLVRRATKEKIWGNEALLKKYRASSADEVIKRVLLAGELNNIVDIINELSGYGSSIEKVKN